NGKGRRYPLDCRGWTQPRCWKNRAVPSPAIRLQTQSRRKARGGGSTDFANQGRRQRNGAFERSIHRPPVYGRFLVVPFVPSSLPRYADPFVQSTLGTLRSFHRQE